MDIKKYQQMNAKDKEFLCERFREAHAGGYYRGMLPHPGSLIFISDEVAAYIVCHCPMPDKQRSKLVEIFNATAKKPEKCGPKWT